MTASETEIRAALERLQEVKNYFSIAVYRIEGEYAIRVASLGATCRQCDKVHLSSGNIGRVARSGLSHATGNVREDATYKSCFSEVMAETVVPISVAGKTIGVIDAESRSAPIDRAELERFAQQIQPLLA